MKQIRSREGFSLVELLVVVAIVAMLAALLTPTIQSSFEHAKSAKCLSNLHQIGTAVQIYVSDPANNGQFPPIFDTAAGSLSPLAALSNYGVTLSVLSCPSDPSPKPSYGSYMWNAVEQGETASDMQVFRRGRVITISKLSRLQLATDGPYGPTTGFPHPGPSFNILWADGHVTSSNAPVPVTP